MRQIIDMWPTQGALAADLGLSCWQVAKWAQRKRIPYWHWSPMVEAARKRGIELTFSMLAEAAATKNAA